MTKCRLIGLVSFMLLAGGVMQAADTKKPDNGFMKFMFRVGNWIDDLALKDVDTSYVTLPDYPWRAALTSSVVGIHSQFTAQTNDEIGRVMLVSSTTPSVDLGFNIGFRTISFSYSWDVMHAYSRRLNFSMGGKQWGIDLQRRKSANIRSGLAFPDYKTPAFPLTDGDVWIVNTNLNAWLALNSLHYSHNAAFKQDYIQKRTAGSLLLNIAYLNTDISFGHDSSLVVPAVLNNVHSMVTHQVAVGLGYGINYTPNNGKVLIHVSATAQAVFYSINYVSYSAPDSLQGFAYPSYAIRPTTPVHFTGTMRLAVSWEINKWVHLNARAQVDNIRFRAETSNGLADLSNWNWQTSLAVGVRLGFGRERVKRGLGLLDTKQVPDVTPPTEPATEEEKKLPLPSWLTDYFFSPTH